MRCRLDRENRQKGTQDGDKETREEVIVREWDPGVSEVGGVLDEVQDRGMHMVDEGEGKVPRVKGREVGAPDGHHGASEIV